MTKGQGRSAATCIGCGVDLPAGSQFCPACGHSTNAQQSAASWPPAPPAPLAHQPPALTNNHSLYPPIPSYDQTPDYGAIPAYPTGLVPTPRVDTDDPWPSIVADGIRDIGSAITDTIGAIQGDRTQVQRDRIGIDRFVITVFSIAFLGAIAFSFYLILVDKTTQIAEFVFPITTGSLGVISGYLAGRGSAGTR